MILIESVIRIWEKCAVEEVIDFSDDSFHYVRAE
jgi:hypothetical protein